MGKVSIGLRGWRFDEDAVFDDDGSFRPLAEMPSDASRRVNRLTSLVNRPCGACRLIHGEEAIERCRVARVVYGEPMHEVLLCNDHESDFVYWFREEGGSQYQGTEDLQDAFYEWFADGGRAPDGYAGLEHVDTAPETLPDPEAAIEATSGAAEEDATATDGEGATASPTGTTAVDGDVPGDDATGGEREADDEGFDLSREYPR